MNPMRYKFAAVLKTLVTEPSNLLCLVVCLAAVAFVMAVLVDAFVQKRRADRLKKAYQKGRV